MKRATEQWLVIAAADLDAGRSMRRSKRLLYAVFEAQQCAEKALKAVIQESGRIPPRIHDLEALAAEAGVPAGMFPDLGVLSAYDIPSRYPQEWENRQAGATKTMASDLLKLAGEVLKWANATLTSGDL